MDLKKLTLHLLPVLYTGVTFALPSDHTVVQGSASLQQNGSQLNITNSNGAIINWQDFSIGNNEAVRFIQNSQNSAVLNRVTGSLPSQILGELQSNGRVFVINPNGILIGQSARIDVGGFVASTLDISNDDFSAGKYHFKGNTGKVENRGFITTAKGGEVVLIAPDVSNSGTIQAENGEIILAAGREVTLQSLDNANISFKVSAPGDSALNLGQLLAQNGSIGVFADSITQKGTLSATRATQAADGSIVLEANADIQVSGNVDVSGSGVDGGQIQILGDEVIVSNATINASGKNGGEILIGGDYQGAGSVKNAANTTVDANTTISADAGATGNGGRVIVWSDGTTKSFAAITARGGSRSGDGGFVETSGKQTLEFGQPADVSASNGQAGTWLIDPEDITIGAAEAESIETALNGGSNVEVKTSDDGDGEGNITVAAPITKTEGEEGVTLTLDAHNRVDVNASISSTAGPLNVNIKTGRQVAGSAPVSSQTSASQTPAAQTALTQTNPVQQTQADPQASVAQTPEAQTTNTPNNDMSLGNGDTEVASLIDQNINQIVVTEDISTAGGSVSIQAGVSGDAIISSTVSSAANPAASNQQAGDITIEANRIALTDDAILDASGESAGTILVGGDQQGQNSQVQNAEFTYMSENAQIKANGGSSTNPNGNGGKVIVFAKDTATVLGTITAKGGTESGDGGFIETSGLRGLRVDKAPDASAVNGLSGEWLIDPYNVTISNAGNNNISGASPFTASASGANLSVTTLLAGLAAGNVTITTAGGGTDAGNITIANEINLSGTSGSHSLTLQAYNDININDSIRGTGANKLTNLNLFADMDGDSNGDVNINSSGQSSMRIGTLNIDVLGSVNIDGNAQNVTITADTSFGYGGNIVINAGAGFNVGSSSNRIGGDFEMDSFGGSNGESAQILSDTFSVYADGDFKLIDGANVNGVKEVRSTSSQIVDVNDILLQGNGNAGAILRLTGAGSQTVNASGTTSLLAGSGAFAIIDTQNASSSQTINSAGKLLINFSGDDAYIQAAGVQNITVGTSGTPQELEITGGAGPTNNGRIQGGAGTQNITVHGNLRLTKGNITGGSGATTVTTDDLNFSQGLIDLNTGTFTINGGSVGSVVNGTFNSQFNDATITNASGSTINHTGGSFILNNSTFTNNGTFNNQGGTFRIDDGTLTNNSVTSLSGGSFDLNLGNFVNASTFNWSGSGSDIDVDSNSTFTSNASSIVNDSATSSFTSASSNFSNSGTYNKTAGTTTFNANFQNTGTVTVDGGSALDFSGTDGAYSQSAGRTVANGTINAGANNLAFTGGRVEGTGNINGSNVTATSTTFAPGNSVGTLNFGGNLDLSGGSNTVEIEADSAASFDQLNVTGVLTMPNSNNVNVTFTNGYTGPIMIGDVDTLTGVITAGAGSAVNPTVAPGGDAGLTVTNTAAPASTALDIQYTRTSNIPTPTPPTPPDNSSSGGSSGANNPNTVGGSAPNASALPNNLSNQNVTAIIEQAENERDQVVLLELSQTNNSDTKNSNANIKQLFICSFVKPMSQYFCKAFNKKE